MVSFLIALLSMGISYDLSFLTTIKASAAHMLVLSRTNPLASNPQPASIILHTQLVSSCKLAGYKALILK